MVYFYAFFRYKNTVSLCRFVVDPALTDFLKCLPPLLSFIKRYDPSLAHQNRSRPTPCMDSEYEQLKVRLSPTGVGSYRLPQRIGS